MKLHLGYHTPRRLPTGGLVEKALVPDHWLVAWASHWTGQQICDVPLQALIGPDADGVLHTAILQCLVDLWFGKSSAGTKDHLFAPPLFPRNLLNRQFLPVHGAVHDGVP